MGLVDGGAMMVPMPAAGPDTPALATTAVTGLTSAEVADRVRQGLVNDVPSRASRSTADIVRTNVFTPFNGLLGALLVAILWVGPYNDALFGFVIVANTLIGIVQEERAKRTLDRLAVVSEATPRAYRDGVVTQVRTNEIVQDDVLDLASGDKVVVDGTALSAAGLEIDESLLTGEADPVVKAPGNPVMSGSFVVAGTGAYRATRVGREAYAAQLAEQAKKFTLARSELRASINRIITVMAILMVPVGIGLLINQFRVTDGVAEAVRGTVAGLVTMVPEGLVLLTSIAFAVGVVRLGRHNVLVQELPAIEGLARVDVVCLDKTGTLTEPVMQVATLVPVGDRGDGAEQALGAIAAAEPRPNASQQAIMRQYAAPDDWAIDELIPFSSARKWSGAAFDGHGTWVLGAPDLLAPGDVAVVEPARQMAGEGLRVLLLARAAGLGDGEGAPPGVQPVALVALEQPIREDAAPTLAYFAAEGVTVKVISGDHPVTVGAIARRLNLPNADDPVDAGDLPTDPGDLEVVGEEHTVFGRVGPEQKQALITALQRRGHHVAMTGDGVNDVLALKDADIGIAMGNGSDASRGVAQLVLLDSRFAVVPGIVAEGRRVIGNIERVANLFLTKTVYATVLSVTVVIAGLPFLFLPRHLTLIGSLTIGIPAFFLALLPNTERARPGFLRRVLRFAVPAGIVAAFASFSAFRVAELDSGNTRVQAQTAAALVLAAVALWVLGIVARPFTPVKLAVVWAMVGGFAVVLVTPWLRTFFSLDMPQPETLVLCAMIAGIGIFLLEVGWRLAGWLPKLRARNGRG